MEEWRNIEEFIYIYQVSSHGGVRRWRKKKREWFYLKPLNTTNGYHRVKLRDKEYSKDRYIHRLVAAAFYGESNLEVNHKDSNKHNNHMDNLEYCNRRENNTHYHRTQKQQSKYPNVGFATDRNKWYSRIMIEGRRKHLGHFTEEEDAYKAYLNALEEYNIKNIYA